MLAKEKLDLLNQKLEQLEFELGCVEKEMTSISRSFDSASRTYGSELAGEPDYGNRPTTIKNIKETIARLERIVSEEIDLEGKKTIIAKRDATKEVIIRLGEKVKNWEEQLAAIQEAKKILGIC